MKKVYGHSDISSVMIERNGVTRSLREWAGVMGVPYPTVRMRYTRGKRNFAELFSTLGLHGSVHVSSDNAKQVTVTRQERTFLDDLFDFDLARRIRAVGEEMDMAPVDVVREMVRHGVEKIERKKAGVSET